MDEIEIKKKIYGWWLNGPSVDPNAIVTELDEVIITEPGSGSQDIIKE